MAVVSLLISGAFPGLLGAQSVVEFLAPFPPAQRAELLRLGEITNFGGSLGELRFFSWAPAGDSLKTALGNPECNVAVEALFWIPREKLSASWPGAGTGASDLLDRKILSVLGDFTSMEGLQYYSVSRKRREVLIQESRMVPSGKAQPGDVVIYQKDNTFGGNTYKITARAPRPGLVRMTMENLETMSWGLIPLVSPGNFRLGLQIHILEEGILVYGLSTVKTLGLFGLERSKEDSFYNRLKAFSSWLESQLVRG